MSAWYNFDFQSEKNPQTHEKTVVVFQDFRTTEHRTDEMRVPDTPAPPFAWRIVPDAATACRQPCGCCLFIPCSRSPKIYGFRVDTSGPYSQRYTSQITIHVIYKLHYTVYQ